MLDFFKDDETGKKNGTVLLNAFLSGFGNLFGKVFAPSDNGKRSTFSFIPQIFGGLFQMIKKFTHMLFDHSNDPVVKAVVKKADDVCDRATKAVKSPNPIKALVQNSYYQDMLPGFDLFRKGFDALSTSDDFTPQHTSKASAKKKHKI